MKHDMDRCFHGSRCGCGSVCQSIRGSSGRDVPGRHASPRHAVCETQYAPNESVFRSVVALNICTGADMSKVIQYRPTAASQGRGGRAQSTAQERANVDQAPNSEHMAAGIPRNAPAAADWSEPVLMAVLFGAFVLGFAMAWSF